MNARSRTDSPSNRKTKPYWLEGEELHLDAVKTIHEFAERAVRSCHCLIDVIRIGRKQSGHQLAKLYGLSLRVRYYLRSN